MPLHDLPENVVQGEPARLFPVLAITSKEGRTTAVFMACLSLQRELGAALLGGVGQRLGVRARVSTYTEVVFGDRSTDTSLRPDGLIVVRVGSREWKALVETKVGSSELQVEQIEQYRALAKENGIDCVITISNQFATSPDAHPLDDVRRSRSRIPVFHWSWMHVLTTVDLLLNNDGVADHGDRSLLEELHRFLAHDSTGVKGFGRMPKEWSDLNKLVSSGGVIPARSPEATAVIQAWHQETRDLSLALSRMTETTVTEGLTRRHRSNPVQRQKDELAELKEDCRLTAKLNIPDAAAPIEVVADLRRRSIDVGMTLRAPEDRKSNAARLNWLLRQIKTDRNEGMHIRLLWPGSSEPTQHSLMELRDNPDICNEGKRHLAVREFHVFLSTRPGARFTQQSNFINDLEAAVPEFYDRVGAHLRVWQRPAPRIQPDPLAEEADGAEDGKDGSTE